jgi:hypothetical protein
MLPQSLRVMLLVMMLVMTMLLLLLRLFRLLCPDGLISIVGRRPAIRTYTPPLRKRSQLLLRNALRQLDPSLRLLLTPALLLQLRILRTSTWSVPTGGPRMIAHVGMVTRFGSTWRGAQHAILTATVRPDAAHQDLRCNGHSGRALAGFETGRKHRPSSRRSTRMLMLLRSGDVSPHFRRGSSNRGCEHALPLLLTLPTRR